MNTISIYEDLPSGGARRLYDANFSHLSQIFNVILVKDPIKSNQIRGIIEYYLYILLAIPYNNCRISDNINDTDIFLVYQSWVTKSPILIRKINVPVIYICHEAPREFYDLDYIRTFSMKEKIVNYIGLIIKRIDSKNIARSKNINIIANSHYSANQIEKVYGIKPEVIYPGISLEMFGQNQKLRFRKNQVISVGSINKLKNQEFIIECISKIETVNRPTLVLVGNGGNSEYIDKVRKIAVDKFVKTRIYLNISDADLVKLYKQSKVFIYSPINEPFGIVVLEAMASGLPIVSIHSGGFSEIISKQNGYLQKDFNSTSWAISINKLLGNNSLWEKISNNNWTLSRKYSEEVMNLKLVETIKRIYNGKE